MGSGLAIPLPGTGRQIRLSVEHTTTRSPRPEHEHESDDSGDTITWFAYRDDEDQTSRAVCPELSLVVERRTVEEAAQALEMLVADYVRDAVGEGRTRAQFARILPRDIINTHVNRLTRVLQLHGNEPGTAWIVGHHHVSHAETSPQAT